MQYQARGSIIVIWCICVNERDVMGGNGEAGVVVEPELEIRDSGIAAFGIGVINARLRLPLVVHEMH